MVILGAEEEISRGDLFTILKPITPPITATIRKMKRIPFFDSSFIFLVI
jgi:hypothetical protein